VVSPVGGRSGLATWATDFRRPARSPSGPSVVTKKFGLGKQPEASDRLFLAAAVIVSRWREAWKLTRHRGEVKRTRLPLWDSLTTTRVVAAAVKNAEAGTMQATSTGKEEEGTRLSVAARAELGTL
jgi:hypothetical protein